MYVTCTCFTLYVPSEEPPVEYWQILAEQRRQALAEALTENEEVCDCICIGVTIYGVTVSFNMLCSV